MCQSAPVCALVVPVCCERGLYLKNSSSLVSRGGELLPAFGHLPNVAQRTNLAEALPHRRDGRRRLSDGHLQGARARSARVPRTRQKAPVHRPNTQLHQSPPTPRRPPMPSPNRPRDDDRHAVEETAAARQKREALLSLSLSRSLAARHTHHAPTRPRRSASPIRTRAQPPKTEPRTAAPRGSPASLTPGNSYTFHPECART